MNKRNLFGALVGALSLPFVTKTAEASPYRSGTYTVPANVNKIRVRSYLQSNQVLDTYFTVEPGQVFKIDAVSK